MRKRCAGLLCLLLAMTFSLPALAAVERGDIIPDLMVKDQEGNEVRISSLLGQYVLFDVWATRCDPCKKAVKGCSQNYFRFEKANIRIVAISGDEDAATAFQFAEKEKAPFLVLHDTARTVGASWGVTSIPAMFLVDPQGKVILKEVGFTGFPTLWRRIKAAMNISADDAVVFPKIKPGAYQAELTRIDWPDLSDNLYTSLFMDYVVHGFAAKRPMALGKEPKYANKPHYGVAEVNNHSYVMAAVDSQETGSMDLLYVDLNRNLDLTDDKPFEVPMYSYYSQIEFVVDGDVPGLLPFLITAYSYDSGVGHYLTTLAGYEAAVSTNGRPMKVLVVDANGNGRFDEDTDVVLLDLDGNGLFDYFSTVEEWTKLGEPFRLNEESYKIKFDAGSKKIIVERV